MSFTKSLVFVAFLAVFFLAAACSDSPKIDPEVEAINVQAQVERFDLEFANATADQIPALKEKYPSLFPSQYPDSFWVEKQADTLMQELSAEVKAKFPDFLDYQQDLTLLFKHSKFYFPSFEPPVVYTVVSEVNYRDPVLARGPEMIIGLDNYLGSDHPFYQGIPLYISTNMKPQQLLPDVSHIIAKNYVPPARDRSFLGQMIYHGKLLYLKSLLLPLESEENIIGYSTAQMQWAKENEVDIWRYFIEKEVLYSTQPKLLNQFINPAPFSKFYLEIDGESPGRIGQYMGWQMVKAFAENTGSSLSEILTTPADILYQQSKYKPKK